MADSGRTFESKSTIAAICALALLAGCDTGQQEPEQRVDEYAAELGTDTDTARLPAGGARSVAEANDVWDFAYAYPAAAGRIAPLKALLDARQKAAFDELKAEAIDARAAADEEGYDYQPHSLNVEWKVVADLPRWLSLSAEVASYEGGAHGNFGFDALLWDKQTGKVVAAENLFAAGALDAAVREGFCAALNLQREERRGEPVMPESEDPFDQCPEIGETTVILGSSNSRTFDRIGFLIGPYVAGPYAEGSFEVTMPVSGAVMRAVKPQYRASFTVTR